MKKAFIALLATILGTFGYAVVDKTIEQRVTTLESQVSSQEEVIESLHGLGNYTHQYSKAETNTTSTTTKIYTTRIEPTYVTNATTSKTYTTSTTSGTTTAVNMDNVVFRNVSNQTKFMFRIYSNGEIRYVRTGMGDYYATTKKAATQLPSEYKEYFAYITNSSASIRYEESTKLYTYYDNNYDIQTSLKEVNTYYTTITVKGKTDPVFAGKKIAMDTGVGRWSSDDYFDSYMECYSENGSVISSDGSFEITYIYKSNYLSGEEICYEINSLNIYWF